MNEEFEKLKLVLSLKGYEVHLDHSPERKFRYDYLLYLKKDGHMVAIFDNGNKTMTGMDESEMKARFVIIMKDRLHLF